MGLAQKIMRVDRVMSNHAQQSRAVTPPILHTQGAGLVRRQIKGSRNIGRHVLIDSRRDVCARIMQGVIEIEQPGNQSMRINVCRSMTADHGADAGISHDFQQQAVINATVDDVNRIDAALGRIKRRRDLRQHAT